jgi:hypothetical protein
MVSFTPLPLYPWEESSRYPLNKRLSGFKSLSWSYGEEENILLLSGIEPLSSNLFAIPTELCRILLARIWIRCGHQWIHMIDKGYKIGVIP